MGDFSTVRAKIPTPRTKPSVQTKLIAPPHAFRGDASARSSPPLAKPSEVGNTTEPISSQGGLNIAHHRRRRVPKLVSACGIPMLRWGKYQSPRISRIIRYKIKSRERIFQQRLALQDQLDMARSEDTWDEILQKHCGMDSESQDPTWSNVWQTALTWTNQRIWQMTKINTDRAREMYAIMQRETALAKAEAIQMKEERQTRRQSRNGPPDHVSEE